MLSWGVGQTGAVPIYPILFLETIILNNWTLAIAVGDFFLQLESASSILMISEVHISAAWKELNYP